MITPAEKDNISNKSARISWAKSVIFTGMTEYLKDKRINLSVVVSFNLNINLVSSQLCTKYLRLKFGHCQIFGVINWSFDAKAGSLKEDHEEGYVYVATMLKSQTVWFMAVGRDRDQRRCQLLSRLPIPLAPLPSLPGTQHQTRPPGPSRRMRGILSAHLLTALHVLTLAGWKPCRQPRGCDRLAPLWANSRVGNRAATSGGSRQFCWWVEESVRNGTLLREWVILDGAAVILPAQQRSDHLFLSRPPLDEI